MVVGSPTTDFLEALDCLLRDCARYFTNADRNNDRFSQKLASDRQNTTYKLLIMWNMALRVCLNRLVFLLFSLAREFSPFRLHEHVLSLLVSKLFISLPPASLFLVLLHFNCDFHDYLTRSRSTYIKCSSGINLLLVLKPRLFGQGYPADIPFTVRNSLTITDFK